MEGEAEMRTALVRKSRWTWVKGLETGEGLDEASAPDFGVLGGRFWEPWDAAVMEDFWVVDRRLIERANRGC